MDIWTNGQHRSKVIGTLAGLHVAEEGLTSLLLLMYECRLIQLQKRTSQLILRCQAAAVQTSADVTLSGFSIACSLD